MHTPTTHLPARLGGGLLLLAPVIFLVGQLIIGSVWSTPYSWVHNNISDLGNVRCGVSGEPARFICSPLHPWWNGIFLLTGLLLAVGVVATWKRCGKGPGPGTAKVLVLVSSAGYVLAGAYPADVNENLHVLGALLILGPGNVALVIAGIAARAALPCPVRLAALGLGVIGIAGSILHLSGHYGVLGLGGSERMAAFALLLWLGLVGGPFLTSPTAGSASRARP